MEGSKCGLTEVLSQHWLGGTEEKQKSLSQDSQCLGQDLNCGLPEHKTKVLQLHQPAWWVMYQIRCDIYSSFGEQKWPDLHTGCMPVFKLQNKICDLYTSTYGTCVNIWLHIHIWT
jgi:hypothetical protein